MLSRALIVPSRSLHDPFSSSAVYRSRDVFAKSEETGLHYREESVATGWCMYAEKSTLDGDIKREGQVQVIAIHPSPGTYLDTKLCAPGEGRHGRFRRRLLCKSERTIVRTRSRGANRDTRQIRIAALCRRVAGFRRARGCVEDIWMTLCVSLFVA